MVFTHRLFLMGAAAFWFGCSNVAREIVSERAIYLRERRSGIRVGAYLASIFTYQFCAGGGSDLADYHHNVDDGEFNANFFAFWAYFS